MSWTLYMEAYANPPDFLSHPGSLTTEDDSHSKLAEGYYVYFLTSHNYSAKGSDFYGNLASHS